jgi:hypothetical protein
MLGSWMRHWQSASSTGNMGGEDDGYGVDEDEGYGGGEDIDRRMRRMAIRTRM